MDTRTCDPALAFKKMATDEDELLNPLRCSNPWPLMRCERSSIYFRWRFHSGQKGRPSRAWVGPDASAPGQPFSTRYRNRLCLVRDIKIPLPQLSTVRVRGNPLRYSVRSVDSESVSPGCRIFGTSGCLYCIGAPLLTLERQSNPPHINALGFKLNLFFERLRSTPRAIHSFPRRRLNPWPVSVGFVHRRLVA